MPKPANAAPSAQLDPQRTIAELKELRAFTQDENGAQRIAFTPKWVATRAWLRQKLAALPVEVHTDAAGNLWATLRGASERELLIGGHMDSVPNGGWLDGCLNVLAGLEILRRINAQYGGKPPVTVRLVDWADEEGARFGKSLSGSAACAGTLDMAEARGLTDKDGIRLPDALQQVGIDFERVKESGPELDTPPPTLNCTSNRGRCSSTWISRLAPSSAPMAWNATRSFSTGRRPHSGSTPMNRRKDAFLAAAKMSPESYRITDRHGGVCTIGSCTTKPGIVTSVVEECRITLDQRHLDAAKLAQMLHEAREASERFAREGNVTVSWDRLWQIEPILFHPDLLRMCGEAIAESGATAHRLPSGPLHDAAEVSRAGVPTIMMFVQSLRGISHNKIEDTKEEHLVLCVEAFDRLAEKALGWLAARR